MPHEISDDDNEAANATRRLYEKLLRLQLIAKPLDDTLEYSSIDLNIQADKRRKLKNATESIKKAHREHRKKLLSFEVLLAIATLGIVAFIRRYIKKT